MNEHRLILGDCLEVLRTLEPGSVDAVVTDPPYGLSFMGQEWDSFGGRSNRNAARDRLAAHQGPGGGNGSQPFGFSGSQVGSRDQMRRFAEFSAKWAAALLPALKPGGYLLAFGGTRTYHRLACAVEDAGFEIRDCLMWLYGTGFPKGKGCLKPAWEPILLARKPGPKVLPLGIDECRVPVCADDAADMARCNTPGSGRFHPRSKMYSGPANGTGPLDTTRGRWPANVVHDGSEEVLEAFAAFGKAGRTGALQSQARNAGYRRGGVGALTRGHGDTGTAARFFYCSKASKRERGPGNAHPTVKPLALMKWLVKLVCPPGGICLDPFMGSGTTGAACLQTGRKYIGVEKMPEYHAIAQKRLGQERVAA